MGATGGSTLCHPGIAILEQSLMCIGCEAGHRAEDPRQPVVCSGGRTRVGRAVGVVIMTAN